jgi:hypothetical protein
MKAYPPSIRGLRSGHGACCNLPASRPGLSRPWCFPFGMAFAVVSPGVPSLTARYGLGRFDIPHLESMP